jgi:transcriptional regulator with XRE-family HTH domain
VNLGLKAILKPLRKHNRLKNMHPQFKVDSAVGQKIRRYRHDAGLTQKEIADRIGVTGAQFHRYESGMTRVAASRLIAIANVLNVRAETLLDGASNVAAKTLLAPANPGQEMIDLLQAFNNLSDSQHRSALLALARAMSSAS